MFNKLAMAMMCFLSVVLSASYSYAYDAQQAYHAWVTISQIEQREGIPKGLLHSISLVESGQGVRGSVLPWPYTIGLNSPGYKTVSDKSSLYKQLNRYKNIGFQKFDLKIDGKIYTRKTPVEVVDIVQDREFVFVALKPRHFSQRFTSKPEAVKFAENLIEHNYENFDIGLMQVNWRYHKEGFLTVEEALDGYRNANYAVSYLQKHRKSRTWWESVGRYHSGTPEHAKRYIQSVWHMYKRLHNMDT